MSDLAVGVTDGEPFSFELAVGLINTTTARNAIQASQTCGVNDAPMRLSIVAMAFCISWKLNDGKFPILGFGS